MTNLETVEMYIMYKMYKINSLKFFSLNFDARRGDHLVGGSNRQQHSGLRISALKHKDLGCDAPPHSLCCQFTYSALAGSVIL